MSEDDANCWVKLCGQPTAVPKDGDCCATSVSGQCQKGKVAQNGTACEIDTTKINWTGIAVMAVVLILIILIFYFILRKKKKQA